MKRSKARKQLHCTFWFVEIPLSKINSISYTTHINSTYLQLFLFIYICVSLYMCIIYMQEPSEAKRRCGSLSTWLWDTMQMLGLKPGSSDQVASAINHWAISPAPYLQFYEKFPHLSSVIQHIALHHLSPPTPSLELNFNCQCVQKVKHVYIKSPTEQWSLHSALVQVQFECASPCA